jgi:1-deoxy-D-xylulose-5-phosphate reductoisomerase
MNSSIAGNHPRPRRVVVLGSTGSIGRSTLAVIANEPNKFEAWALVARSDIAQMREQILTMLPAYAVMVDPAAARHLRETLPPGIRTEVLSGEESACDLAAHALTDSVVAAVVGAAGLPFALAAARAGKRILLANKEALVMAGRIFMDAVQAGGATLLPVDSEHNAIFQCLPVAGSLWPHTRGVRRVLLTASGGPFRRSSLREIEEATPDHACAHPNWSMGRKISVDSATMMNKGLELIEAAWLFDLAPSQLDVVVHPQSIVHSLVEYLDGSMLAQLGNPDMRTPIAHALAWPERCESGVSMLDLARLGRLDFEAPDLVRFPCLRLALEAITAGGAGPCVLNGANEMSVAQFLAGGLRFGQIAQINESVMNRLGHQPAPTTLNGVLDLDRESRAFASQLLAGAH